MRLTSLVASLQVLTYGVESMRLRLAFLREIGLEDATIGKAVPRFPQVQSPEEVGLGGGGAGQLGVPCDFCCIVEGIGGVGRPWREGCIIQGLFQRLR